MKSTSIAETISFGTSKLRERGVQEPRLEASLLIASVIGRDRTFLLTHPEESLEDAQHLQVENLIERRSMGEPLQYILGTQEFYGLEFEVTPDVLIPRPETELLVEYAIEILQAIRGRRDVDLQTAAKQPVRICDVGSGSGCIIVSLLKEIPDAFGVALDISEQALAVATRNAARHRVADRLSLHCSDCFSVLDSSLNQFEMIVSNPPYVPEDAIPGLQREVREHEPLSALTPGGDGLGMIRRLIAESPDFLVASGHLLFEIGFGQHEVVAQMINQNIWELVGIRPDLAGIPRTTLLRKK